MTTEYEKSYLEIEIEDEKSKLLADEENETLLAANFNSKMLSTDNMSESTELLTDFIKSNSISTYKKRKYKLIQIGSFSLIMLIVLGLFISVGLYMFIHYKKSTTVEKIDYIQKMSFLYEFDDYVNHLNQTEANFNYKDKLQDGSHNLRKMLPNLKISGFDQIYIKNILPYLKDNSDCQTLANILNRTKSLEFDNGLVISDWNNAVLPSCIEEHIDVFSEFIIEDMELLNNEKYLRNLLKSNQTCYTFDTENTKDEIFNGSKVCNRIVFDSRDTYFNATSGVLLGKQQDQTFPIAESTALMFDFEYSSIGKDLKSVKRNSTLHQLLLASLTKSPLIIANIFDSKNPPINGTIFDNDSKLLKNLKNIRSTYTDLIIKGILRKDTTEYPDQNAHLEYWFLDSTDTTINRESSDLVENKIEGATETTDKSDSGVETDKKETEMIDIKESDIIDKKENDVKILSYKIENKYIGRTYKKENVDIDQPEANYTDIVDDELLGSKGILIVMSSGTNKTLDIFKFNSTILNNRMIAFYNESIIFETLLSTNPQYDGRMFDLSSYLLLEPMDALVLVYRPRNALDDGIVITNSVKDLEFASLNNLVNIPTQESKNSTTYSLN